MASASFSNNGYGRIIDRKDVDGAPIAVGNIIFYDDSYWVVRSKHGRNQIQALSLNVDTGEYGLAAIKFPSQHRVVTAHRCPIFENVQGFRQWLAQTCRQLIAEDEE
jgi:hypothetical protein